MKRGRNQRRRPGGGSNPNRALDSNGPDVRIRGTANQIYDKYQALARDATSSGDRVKAESYLQHAEHYFRLIRAMQPAQPAGQQPGQQAGQQPGQQQAGETDGEQPNIAAEGENERPQREARKPRERQHNSDDAGAEAKAPEETADKAEAEVATTEAAASEEAAPAEEEKKPRRRRAPRRAKKTDDESAETPTTAAAE